MEEKKLSETTAYRYLFRCLYKYGASSPKLISEIEKCTKFQVVSKKTLLQECRSQSRYLYFIAYGICRKYYIKNSQEEVIDIKHEGHFLVSYESFFFRKKSREYIETLEETSLIRISYADLINLVKEFPEIESIRRQLAEGLIAEKELFDYMTRNERAENKVSYVLNHPKMKRIIERISNYHVASYLQMTSETFSRGKKKILKK